MLVHVALDAECAIPTEFGIELDRERASIAVVTELGQPLTMWEPLGLELDLSKVHLFDLDTGAAVARPDAAPFTSSPRGQRATS